MSNHRTASIVATLLLSASSIASAADDQVVASFERLFNHQASYAVPAATVSHERDPLERAVVGALGSQWSPYPVGTADSPTASAGDEPAIASFQRMLDHRPARTSPAVPAGLGEDPLVATVVVPLRLRGPHPVGPLHAELPQSSTKR